MVVVTKIDQTNDFVTKETLSNLGKLLKSQSVRKIPLLVNERSHVAIAAQNFASGRVAPIFKISSVTGVGLDNLKNFLNLIQPKNQCDAKSKSTEFVVDEIFTVVGVGTVVSGILSSGTISTGDILQFGPDSSGNFKSVTIKSMERKRISIKTLEAGESAALALKKIKRCEVTSVAQSF